MNSNPVSMNPNLVSQAAARAPSDNRARCSRCPAAALTLFAALLLQSCGGSSTAAPTPAPTTAPDLADLGNVSRAVGAEIAPIAFTNTGGAVQATGGCAVTTGALPSGLMLRFNSATPASCEIHGTPMGQPGTANVTVTATNANGNDTATVRITITAGLSRPNLANLARRSLMIGAEITPIAFANTGGAVQATGGCAVTTGALPTGLMLRVNSATPASCEIHGTPMGQPEVATITITATNAAGSDTAAVEIVTAGEVADSDSDGLIEIDSLERLNNIRHNLAGTSYRTAADDAGLDFGCPAAGCVGYELTASLSFDSDGDGTWTLGDDGAYALDDDDHNADYFDTNAGGWAPISDCGADATCGNADDNAFSAILEGNGHTITGLATIASGGMAAMIGLTTAAAQVRNIGLVDNLAVHTGTGPGFVGGLVGRNLGQIAGSYTTGPVHASSDGLNRVGALVGSHSGGGIIASYATGDASTSGGDSSTVGGLASDVQTGATITACYATGDVAGSDAGAEAAAGLVAWSRGGSITASYATGDADTGTGNGEFSGSLVGLVQESGRVSDSYGFGTATGGTVSTDGAPPTGSTSAQSLTFGSIPAADTDAAASWNDSASSTLFAWHFGDSTHPPILLYADYDGTGGGAYHCHNAPAPPANAILIHSCPNVPGTPLPGQPNPVYTGPALIPISLSGQATPLYRYEIGRSQPAQRRIAFATGDSPITGCTAADDDLPDGMSIDSATCAITGSPTRRGAAATTHTVTATDASGSTSAVITIETYHHNPPVIHQLSAGTITLIDNSSEGLPLVFPNTGGAVEECWSLSADGHSNLYEDAVGLEFEAAPDFSTCQINLVEGRLPRAATKSTYFLAAGNSHGYSELGFDLVIARARAAPTPPSALTASVTEFTFTANEAITPVTFTATGSGRCSIAPKEASGAPLPVGLSVDPVSCAITGAPRQAIAVTAYTVSLARGGNSATAEISISVADPAAQLVSMHSASLSQGSPAFLPILIPATAGLPTGCAEAIPTGSGTQGPLADYNLFLYPTPAGCVIDSLDGQGPTPTLDNMPLSLSYEITPTNAAGSGQASALSLAIEPSRPIRVAVVGDDDVSCALSISGRLHCWGKGNPALGNGVSRRWRPLPARIGSAVFSEIDGGDIAVCAIDSNQDLYCWGDGSGFVLGVGDSEIRNVPTQVGVHRDNSPSVATGWTKVSVGSRHACAIHGNDRNLYCWGLGNDGRLGLGVATNRSIPNQAGVHQDDPDALATGWTDIGAGSAHTCAIRDSAGHLYCWGFSGNGQTGLNIDSPNQLSPQRVGTHQGAASELAEGWTDVATGINHTCAIHDSAGHLYCWGTNGQGELGIGTTSTRETSPQRVGIHEGAPSGLAAGWTSVSAGRSYTCATKRPGSLYCWGLNTDGKLGVGGSSRRTVPTQVGAGQPHAAGWKSVAASSENHTCATRVDNTAEQLWCWGSNEDDALGIEGIKASDTPAQVNLPQ